MEDVTKAFVPHSSRIIIGDLQNLGKLVTNSAGSADLAVETLPIMSESDFHLPTPNELIEIGLATILETEYRSELEVPSTVLPQVSAVVPPSNLGTVPNWIPVKFWTTDLLGNYPKFLEQAFEVFSGLDLDTDGFGDTSQTVTTSRLQGWLDLDEYDGETVQISANIKFDYHVSNARVGLFELLRS